MTSHGIEEAWIAVAGVGAGGIIGVAGTWIGAFMSGRSAKATTDATIAANSADIRTQIEASKAATDATLAANSADIKAQIEGSKAATDAQIKSAADSLRDQIEAERQGRIWDKRAAAYTQTIRGIRHQQGVRARQVRHLITGDEPNADPAPVDWKSLEADLIAYGTSDILDALEAASNAGIKFRGTYRTVNEMGPSRERGELVQQARQEAESATLLDDKVMDTIRAELQASTGASTPQPVPRGPLGVQGG